MAGSTARGGPLNRGDRPKSFALGNAGVTRSLAKARGEAAKGVLLCATCHAEVEMGVKRLPLRPMTTGEAAA